MRCALVLLVSVLPLGTGEAAAGTPAPYDLPETGIHYRIEASLDPESREVSGIVELVWRSPAAEVLGSVRVHLYLNAFSHEGTTWMGGARTFRLTAIRRLADLFENPWGYIELNQVTRDRRELPSPVHSAGRWEPTRPQPCRGHPCSATPAGRDPQALHPIQGACAHSDG